MPCSKNLGIHEIMEPMAPYAGIGRGEISIIDLDHCIIVPEPDVGYADSYLWYEVAMLAETTFVEICDLTHGYV
jgi:hypothetical protein